jgi:phosphoserine phosphatase RsbU/P
VLVLDLVEQDLHRPPVAHSPSPGGGDGSDRAAWVKLCNLQRRILPHVAPPVTGYRLEFAYRPAFAVTGDYHDFFPRPDGTVAAFVGDGSGHGPAASMLMAMMLTILRTHDIHSDPGTTLTRAGQIFHQLIPSDLFMTGVYLLLKPRGEVEWTAAGHHPPVHVARRGAVNPIDLTVIGPVLGLGAAQQYDTVRAHLDVGDRLLMFTDGLWDARDASGEPFSRMRIGQHVQYTMDDPLDEAVRGLVAKVTEHVSGAEFEDDFTILGVERLE